MKVAATGAVLLVHAALVLALDALMGLSIGGTGLVAWGSWKASNDLSTTLVLAAVGLLQLAALVGSVLGAGFAALAGFRGVQGDGRSLRAAALVAIGMPAVLALASLPGLSCLGAVFWTVPLTLGVVALALAREVEEESADVKRDW